jgi:hypothetical protein
MRPSAKRRWTSAGCPASRRRRLWQSRILALAPAPTGMLTDLGGQGLGQASRSSLCGIFGHVTVGGSLYFMAPTVTDPTAADPANCPYSCGAPLKETRGSSLAEIDQCVVRELVSGHPAFRPGCPLGFLPWTTGRGPLPSRCPAAARSPPSLPRGAGCHGKPGVLAVNQKLGSAGRGSRSREGSN